jgi:hypothetical protein
MLVEGTQLVLPGPCRAPVAARARGDFSAALAGPQTVLGRGAGDGARATTPPQGRGASRPLMGGRRFRSRWIRAQHAGPGDRVANRVVPLELSRLRENPR